MKLTDFFGDLGHPVAYYGKLNKITGSAIATIFLSQFLYWEGKQKDPDGWIYKTQADIEDETGLNRREQENARKQLVSLSLMQERRKGLPARLEFLPMLDEINRQWTVLINEGYSIALENKQSLASKKMQNFEGSKPCRDQVVQVEQASLSDRNGSKDAQAEQTRASKSSRQASASRTVKDAQVEQSRQRKPRNQERSDRADNIYTETTSRDHLQRLQAESTSEITPDLISFVHFDPPNPIASPIANNSPRHDQSLPSGRDVIDTQNQDDRISGNFAQGQKTKTAALKAQGNSAAIPVNHTLDKSEKTTPQSPPSHDFLSEDEIDEFLDLYVNRTATSPDPFDPDEQPF